MKNINETKNKSDKKISQIRSQERIDYKIEPSRGLDVAAAIISAVIAVIIWLYS